MSFYLACFFLYSDHYVSECGPDPGNRTGPNRSNAVGPVQPYGPRRTHALGPMTSARCGPNHNLVSHKTYVQPPTRRTVTALWVQSLISNISLTIWPVFSNLIRMYNEILLRWSFIIWFHVLIEFFFIILLLSSCALFGHIWGLWRQKQVSQAGISNCIPQNTVGCNYLFMP